MIIEPPSRAEEFFKRVTKNVDPSGYLKALVNSAPPTEETEWLDFIAADRLDENSIDGNWSKALSGFANTEGGVLIWGIKADKTGGVTVDQANALALAPNCSSLKTRLKDRLPFLTDPPVHSVEVIDYAVSGTAGFVLCYVPRSSFKPHRDELKKRFYIRITDDFKEPSVTWLRRMFAPEIGPDLQLFLEILPQTTGVLAGQQQAVTLAIFMVNRGMGTAYDMFFTIVAPNQQINCDRLCWHGGKSAEAGTSFSALRSVHPGELYPVVALSRVIINQEPTSFSLKLFAQNMAPMICSTVIQPDQQGVRSRVDLKVEPLRR